MGGGEDMFSQSSDNILPDVDIVPEDKLAVPDQGYIQRTYSHKDLNTNVAGIFQTLEKPLNAKPQNR